MAHGFIGQPSGNFGDLVVQPAILPQLLAQRHAEKGIDVDALRGGFPFELRIFANDGGDFIAQLIVIVDVLSESWVLASDRRLDMLRKVVF